MPFTVIHDTNTSGTFATSMSSQNTYKLALDKLYEMAKSDLGNTNVSYSMVKIQNQEGFILKVEQCKPLLIE